MAELRQAAERLRSLVPQHMWETVGPEWTREDRDLWLCAFAYVAYLAEHPADDDEPIDEAWFDSFSVPEWPHGTTCKTIAGHVWIDDTNTVYLEATPLPHIKTRGDVRRLLAALGVK